MATKIKKKQPTEQKVCTSCNKLKVINSFYATRSSMYSDGRVPICKPCVQKEVDVNDLNTVKRMLRIIDKPFILIEWKKCMESGKEPFGWYIRLIGSLPQYKGMSYDDSIGEKISDQEYRKTTNQESIDDIEEISSEDGKSIKVTQEVMLKFGADYTNREYLEMEKFYQDMMSSHEIVTPPHKKLLINLCKLNIEMDRLLDAKDYGNYEKLSRQYELQLKSAGFRPVDRVSGNESAGIRTFSQIFEEIEKDGFIVPASIEENQDIVDRTILYLANYTKKLLNMEQLIAPPPDTPKIDS